MQIRKFTPKDVEIKWGTIDNFQDLASILGLPPRLFSYVRKYKKLKDPRHVIQRLNKIDGRDTYVSCKQLKAIQNQLNKVIFEKLVQSVPNNEHMLAYVKGRSYIKFVRDNCIGHDLEVAWDVKGCYDHISYKMIVKTLMSHGFTHRGAKFVAGYCTVERTLPNGKTISTLQQGSICSPALSNLVCYEYIDKPIMEWVDAVRPSVERAVYTRYSDNVAFFVTGDFGPEKVKDYLRKSHSLLAATHMRNHKVFVTPKNHPHRNQKFLGIVLNKVARIETEEYHKVQSILFNAVRNGIGGEARRYVQERYYENTGGDITVLEPEDINKKFISVMRGKASYIGQINPLQYVPLKNLLNCLKFLKEKHYRSEGTLNDDLFQVVKKYKRLGTVEFLDQLSDVLGTYEVPEDQVARAA